MHNTKYFLVSLFCFVVHFHSTVKAQESYYLSEEKWNHMIGEREQGKQAYAFEIRDAALPDVLIIGNSISIGYTAAVRSSLKGLANVYRIPENVGDSRKFLANYEKWLSSMDWDVIHVNVGLHDLKRLDGDGNLNSSFERNTSPDQYQANLEQIFRILEEETNAQIIWATTTLVPEGSEGRIPGDEELYNERSHWVLKQYPAFHLNDLYQFSLGITSLQREANVHYLPEGSEKLGIEVARVIKKVLNTEEK